jgi:hypothetical protein
MIFFSIGLPSRFAEWCDAFLVRLVEHRFGSVEAVSVNGLDELASVAIRTPASNLVACSRHPVVRLQSEVLEAGRPFLVALGDPRAALPNLADRSGSNLVEATRALASSCAAMLTITNAPHALVLTPKDARDLPVVAAAIAQHFQIPIGTSEFSALIEPLPSAETEETDGRSWWGQLSEREQSIVDGALQPYIAQFQGRGLERVIWEPELFYTTADPAGPTLVAPNAPIDITGRVRFLVYGPYITLPPGQWSVDVVLGFSAEAGGMGFVIEVFAGTQLASTRIEVAGEQVVEARLNVTIGNSVDQPVEIRVFNERAAFDGRLVLGYVSMTPQAALPEETRERLANVLRH